MQKKPIALLVSLLCLSSLAIAVACVKKLGYSLTYQTTESMPRGWYLIKPIKHLKKGDIVVFSPPTSIKAFLVQHQWLLPHALMMKQVVGIPSDRLCIRRHAVWINTIKIASVQQYYRKGKKLPQIHYCARLAPNNYWLMSPHVAHAFDSRYFGPVARNTIKGKAIKL